MHYDAEMRTTIDLPEDLHRIAISLSRDKRISLSEAVSMLLRKAIGEPGSAQLEPSGKSGMLTIKLGRIITASDVRALDDDQ